MLLTGRDAPTVDLLTPGHRPDTTADDRGASFVSCAIQDGDDPDVTRDALIFARVQKTDAPASDRRRRGRRPQSAGSGNQPVGAAAINSVPAA